MKISPAAALDDVSYATRARQLAEQDTAQTIERQTRAIRAALDAGAKVDDVAARAKLSRRRIYQISGSDPTDASHRDTRSSSSSSD